MKTLKDIIIRHSTPNEHNDFIEIMSEGLYNKDPKVGIFGIIHNKMNYLGLLLYL